MKSKLIDESAKSLRGDMAERKEAQIALLESQQLLLRQERLAAVGQLAAGLAHEFNNTLATVHGMVTQHQGWIEVRSQPGRGTTFDLYFPATDLTPHRPAEQPGPPEVSGGKETILVVEDEFSKPCHPAQLARMVRQAMDAAPQREACLATPSSLACNPQP